MFYLSTPPPPLKIPGVWIQEQNRSVVGQGHSDFTVHMAHPGILLEGSSVSGDVEWDRLFISNKLSGDADADAAGLGPHRIHCQISLQNGYTSRQFKYLPLQGANPGWGGGMGRKGRQL